MSFGIDSDCNHVSLTHGNIFDFVAGLLVLVCECIHFLAIAILHEHKGLRYIIAKIVFHYLTEKAITGGTPYI